MINMMKLGPEAVAAAAEEDGKDYGNVQDGKDYGNVQDGKDYGNVQESW